MDMENTLSPDDILKKIDAGEEFTNEQVSMITSDFGAGVEAYEVNILGESLLEFGVYIIYLYRSFLQQSIRTVLD